MPPVVPVDRLRLLFVGQFLECRDPRRADWPADRLPGLVAGGAAGEHVEQVVDHGGRGNGIDVGRGRGGDGPKRAGLRGRILACDRRLELEPRGDESIPRGQRRALADEAHHLPGHRRGGMPVGRGPRELAHRPVELVPVEISLEFQGQLFGHHGRENLRRRDGVVAVPRLLQKPAVELPRFERLPQVEAAADKERIGLVVVLQAANEDLVEPRRHAAAGLVGRQRRDAPLVERGCGLQVARGEGRVARYDEDGRPRRRMAGEPGLEGDRGGVGVARLACLREKLDDLRLGRVGGELRRLRLGRMGRMGRDEAGGERQETGHGVHGAFSPPREIVISLRRRTGRSRRRPTASSWLGSSA